MFLLTAVFIYLTIINALLMAPDAELTACNNQDVAQSQDAYLGEAVSFLPPCQRRADAGEVHPLLDCMIAHQDENADVMTVALKTRVKTPVTKPAPNGHTKPSLSAKPAPSKSMVVQPSITKASPSGKPSSATSCKEVIRLAELSSTQQRGLDLPDQNEFTRGTYIGGMATLAKRTRKNGTAFRMDFNAGEYPESGHALMVYVIDFVHGISV